MFFLSWLTARGSGMASVCFSTDTLSPTHSHHWLSADNTAKQFHNKINLDARQSLSVAHPLNPHCLLIIVNWSVYWYARVQRSTCTSWRIPSHANPTLRIVKAEIDLSRHGLLAWWTKLVDGRHRTLHLRYLSHAGGAALANLICTIPTTGTKLVATATSLERSNRELQIFHQQP